MEPRPKEMCYCNLIILLVLYAVSAVNSENTITIIPNDSEYALVDYLCGDQHWQITNQTIMTLDPAEKHVIPQRLEQLCVLRNKQDIVLQSSNQNEPAVISCTNGEEMMSHTGFRFVNITNLTIRNIQFENCGGIINDTSLAPSGTSPENAILNKQQAVLVLSTCTNVNIVNVTINSYHGYAVFAVNLYGDVQIQRLNVTNSMSVVRKITSSNRNDLLESGSGVILHFNNENVTSTRSSRIYITDSTTFTNNFNVYPQSLLESLLAMRIQNQPKDFPIFGAGGLSVHFEQQRFKVQVFVEDTVFTNNGGSASGGAVVYSRNTINNADISFNGCTFTNNSVSDFSEYIGGGGLQLLFVFSYPDLPMVVTTAGMEQASINIENTNFSSHSSVLGAAVAIYNEAQNIKPISIRFSRTKFVDNEATNDGDCILVRSERSAYYREQPLEIFLESIHIEHSGRSSNTDASSALSFVGVPFVTITGSEDYPTVLSNGDNRALKAYNTNLFLSGILTFAQNSASRGGAIALKANSHLFFVEPANILFLNNSATVSGGAIYSDFVSGAQCIIQFITPPSNYSTDTIQDVAKLTNLNFDIQFVDNTAMDGNSVYAQPLYACRWYSESVVQIPSDQIDSVYEELFHFTLDSQNMRHTSEMRSYPYKPCFCHNDTLLLDESGSNCHYFEPINVDTYPGRSFTMHIIAVDSLGRSLGTLIQTQVSEKNGESVSFQSGSQQQISIHEVLGNECSHLKYTLYSNDNITAKLSFSIPNTGSQTIQAVVNLQTCPLGFKVNQDRGSCECVPVFSQRNIVCDIDKGTFFKNETVWIGPTDFTDPPAPAYATRCPEGYCKQETAVPLNETNSISQTDRCQGHRTGEICGKCIPGYSMRFGTAKCYASCSNYYLLTIPMYMIAGILLVFLLFLLKISTASGMLIVVLYYAQLISINLGLLIQTDETRFAYVFISLLNLELGFPLCFYEGMTFIGKHGLQYVFPVYLWFLVALLTILSRFSTRVSNLIGSECIKVFVTLMYLSYTKILRTAFSALVPTYVRTDEQSYSVWFFDGTQKFLSGNHLYLAIASIVFLVFVIAPYKIFLFSAQWSLRSSWISTRFKPLIDASLAPFKDRYRFWFGLRLMIIAVLVIVAIFFTPSYPDVVTYVHLVIIFILTIIQAYIKPYKSKIVNILDIFFLVNYSLFLIGCLFVFSGVFGSEIDGLLPYIAAVELLAIGTTFIVFVGVIIYHIVERVKSRHKMSFDVGPSVSNDASKAKPKEIDPVIQGRETNRNLCEQNVTSFSEMDRLREPLLEDDNY